MNLREDKCEEEDIEFEIESIKDQLWVVDTEISRLSKILNGDEIFPSGRKVEDIERMLNIRISKKEQLKKELERLNFFEKEKSELKEEENE